MRKMLSLLLLILLPASDGLHADTVIIRGTGSTTDRAELSYVRQVTDRTSRWLTEEGLPHRVLDDAAVARQGLGKASVVLLPYNPSPPAKTRAAVRRLVENGGHALVCYSADAALAKMLHFRLGPYTPLPAPGHWAAFRFTRDAPPFLPPLVRQESRNIRPAYPAGRGAYTIAWWQNAAGERTGEPAWVLSTRGAWMSHIMTEEDAGTKRRLLVGLITHFDASAWEHAALHQARTAGTVGRFKTLRDTFDTIQRHAAESGRTVAVRGMLHDARALAGAIQGHIVREEFIEAVTAGRELDLRMQAAYGRAQAARADEFRGVWEHHGTGLYPGEWGRSMRTIADSGMSAVFANVQWAGLAHYESDVLPRSSVYARYGDQLAQCVAAGRKYGVEVHAWKVCWNLTRAPDAFVARMRKAGRLQVSDSGRELPWLCPTHAENVALELDAIAELAANYAVDGVHLDYIRFPGASACFCELCHRRFQADTGLQVRRWPRDAAVGGRHRETFNKWRAGRINTFVKRAAERVRGVRPDTRLSAAVWGAYPDIKSSIAQDWPLWLERGWIDFACPMIYFDSAAEFQKYTRIGMSAARGKPVFPGIGVTARESRLDPVGTIDQIRIARKTGAAGFMLYQLDDTLVSETLPILRMGTTARN